MGCTWETETGVLKDSDANLSLWCRLTAHLGPEALGVLPPLISPSAEITHRRKRLSASVFISRFNSFALNKRSRAISFIPEISMSSSLTRAK